MNWSDRIAHYDKVTGFPTSLFVAGDGRVIGMVKSTNHRFRVLTIFRRI